ncbi:hypothetical protein BS17DRAFT_776796 [Gyrodon lividus]|nr:hypothetical protein BS17DRAFT_776796 [Gyrodon lividus]
MPDVTIINNLEEPIHVAFSVVAPTNWKNNLQPNERWTTHLATLPLHFQVRWAERTDRDSMTVYRSREFSPGESWETGGTIGIACAAGTASVVTAAVCTAVGMGGLGAALATPLMLAANAGERSWFCSYIIYYEHKER